MNINEVPIMLDLSHIGAYHAQGLRMVEVKKVKGMKIQSITLLKF